ncbi:hypothetical protein FVEG_16378 [Fusarium verticillioides 7600]|uniref:Uncharacterized protein n=1 Tax=Gibberella moniliformis (strain M3125 / FGSC 7600) TaxID=334819 RepID=W7MDD3_GIBM7|nr:hypothetical protein FVEG_16378 [Fusarium verticillioides 7600]EWG48991.1 hypothetical protein FVEG_16378 [Fusarium verticillioides 7600]
MDGEDEPEKESHVSTKSSSTGNRTITGSKALLPIKKLDAFISRLNRLMHTRESHDALILFLAYAAHFVATVLETPLPDRLKSWLLRFNEVLMTIVPPRLKSLLSTFKGFPTISSLSANKLLIAERFRALSDILDDWQIITRLWGLLATWAEAKEFLTNLTSENQSEEKKRNPRKYFVLTAIRASYLLGLFGYYGTENLAWLTRRGVFKWSERTESKLMIWSLKAWGIYVMSGMAQLLYDRYESKRTGEGQDEEERIEWRRNFIHLFLYGPLTIHWIRDGGLFPEAIASFLAAYTEFITVKGLWKDC